MAQVGGRLRPLCPACGHVVYEHLKVGAGILLVREGELLLLRRPPTASAFPSAWNLPAGYCEADESPQQTARREAKEETGLTVEVGRLVDAYFFNDDPRGNGVLLVYEGRVTGGNLQPNEREVAAVGYFAPDRLPVPLCGGGHDQAIRAWRSRALDRWRPGELPRYCPHCTHPLEERLAFGRLRLACPTCGFVHFRGLKVGVSVMVVHEGRLLLVRRGVEPGLGLWGLPSGFVEWDESPAAAAGRECREETGLEVAIVGLLEASYYSDDYRGPGVNFTYRAEIVGGRLQSGDDATAARFFSPAELPAEGEIAFRGHRRLLARWQADPTFARWPVQKV